ncbi:hypothetical protein B0H12DRAFT_1122294 [Mycena haematopus]|nr:hypothetical protein B0H12DRAFT_1122294 [Mycena haematopus]
MKTSPLLWLLAAALAASAQSSNGTDSAASTPSLPASSASLASTTSDPGTSSSAPPPSSPPPTSPPPTQPPSSPPPTSTSSFSASVVSLSQSVGTDSAGNTVTVEESLTIPNPANSAAAAASSSAAPSPSGSSLSTGGIIGLAVAGGTALVCLIAFFVWKFTRKRGLDFDDGENIKWPELNAHSGDGNADVHAMPVTNTGRAGFSDASESGMSRAPSVANTYGSTADFHAGDDPYAVPPLPHMNPALAQPYHDDPNAAGHYDPNATGGAYYDPYRGPVPPAFNDPQHGEAIPMTQMAGRASPGPMRGYTDASRTGSPAPRMASPGPGQAYAGGYATGRASPGPGQAYGGM